MLTYIADAVDDFTDVDAAWMNAIRDRAFSVFADDTARAAIVAAPDAGRPFYYRTGGVDEGLYLANTAGKVQLPWALPWGWVASGSSTTTVATSGTTETLLKTSDSFTAVANRRYKVTFETTTDLSVLNDIFNVRLRLNSTAGTQIRMKRVSYGANSQQGLTLVAEFTATGSTTVVYTGQRIVGTGSLGTLASLDHAFLIEDIGPAGGPV